MWENSIFFLAYAMKPVLARMVSRDCPPTLINTPQGLNAVHHITVSFLSDNTIY